MTIQQFHRQFQQFHLLNRHPERAACLLQIFPAGIDIGRFGAADYGNRLARFTVVTEFPVTYAYFAGIDIKIPSENAPFTLFQLHISGGGRDKRCAVIQSYGIKQIHSQQPLYLRAQAHII